MKMGNWSKKEINTLESNMKEYLKVFVRMIYMVQKNVIYSTSGRNYEKRNDFKKLRKNMQILTCNFDLEYNACTGFFSCHLL